jgi:outer membrane cobalamin receptor
MTMTIRIKGAAVALLACLASACATTAALPAEEDRRGRVITAEEIERSQARDAWEVLQRSGTNLSMSQSPNGTPTRLSSRGRASMLLSSLPIVIVDGVRLVDFRTLREIPAHIISRVQVLNGVDGTRYFGTGGGNGVIVIQTAAAAR